MARTRCVSTLVRLRGNPYQMAIVQQVPRPHTENRGWRRLDRRLAGFLDWHRDEREVVPPTSPLRRWWRG